MIGRVFGEDVAVPALDEGRGQDQIQVVLLEAALGAHLDRVAEPGGGDERRVGSRAGDDGVGGDRSSVDEGVEVGQVGARLGDHLGDAVHLTRYLVVVSTADAGHADLHPGFLHHLAGVQHLLYQSARPGLGLAGVIGENDAFVCHEAGETQ